MDEIGLPLEEIFDALEAEAAVTGRDGELPINGAWPEPAPSHPGPVNHVPAPVDPTAYRPGPPAGYYSPIDLPPALHSAPGDLAYYNRPAPGDLAYYNRPAPGGQGSPATASHSAQPNAAGVPAAAYRARTHSPHAASRPATPEVDYGGSPALLTRPAGRPKRSSHGRPKRHWIKTTWLRRTVKAMVATGLVIAAVVASLFFYAYYRYSQVKKVTIPAIVPVNPAINPGENILLVGSDTLAPFAGVPVQPGGSAPVPASAPTSTGGGASGSASHADVIMLFHLDLSAGTASVLSIPPLLQVTPQGQSTPVTMDSIFGQGPATLVSAISSLFGIPINHYVGIDDAGIEGLVDSLGGINLRFDYPVQDPYSGFDEERIGCDSLDGSQALELLRSNDYQFEQGFNWTQDTTGSYGAADRQRVVLAAVGSKAVSSGITNPITGNRFLGSFVDDVTLDSNFSFPDVFSLVNQLSSTGMTHATTYTFSTYVVNGTGGDILLEYDPAAAEQVVDQFLGEPSPNGAGASSPGSTSGTAAGGITAEAGSSGSTSGTSDSGAPGAGGVPGADGATGLSGGQAPSTYFDPRTC